MNTYLRWAIGSSPKESAEPPDSLPHERADNPSSLIITLGLSLMALCVSALVSGSVVLVISKFGADSGLPALGFRGALSLALVGSWFSMGTAEVRKTQGREFPKFLIETLANQIGSALLMLLLVGALSLLLGWGTG